MAPAQELFNRGAQPALLDLAEVQPPASRNPGDTEPPQPPDVSGIFMLVPELAA